MAIYTVHVPAAGSDRLAMAERAILTPEAFSRGAFLLGPLWFAFNRAWLGLLVNLVALAGIVTFIMLVRPTGGTVAALILLLALFIGFEARQLVRLGLEVGGFRPADVVVARDSSEAERAFFLRWLAVEPPAKPPATSPMAAAADDEVIGMFPHPEFPRPRGQA